MRFDGEDVTGLRSDRLTRRGLNFVPQIDNVFPTLTVAENLHVGALVLPRAERHAEIARVLELFPLLAERSTPARRHALRRAAQARRARARTRRTARSCSSSTSRLPGSRRIAIDLVFEKLVEIHSLGIAIVMVEQNARRALALADTAATSSTPAATRIERPGRDAARRPPGRRALPGRLGDDRVELDLDEHSVGDESADEVGRVRRIDSGEGLRCARTAASQSQPSREQQPRPDHVLAPRTELRSCRERLRDRLAVCA